MGRKLEALAKTRQVIGVDLQAHGRTADIDRPMTHEAMADDIGALIAHLGLAQVDVMGYSLGGGVAIQTALRHRDRVRKLVVVSTPFARSASYPSGIAAFDALGSALADAMKPSPEYQLYQKVAPRPQDFPRMLDKLGALAKQDYDWTADAARLRRRCSSVQTRTTTARRMSSRSTRSWAAVSTIRGGMARVVVLRRGSRSSPGRRTTTSCRRRSSSLSSSHGSRRASEK